MKKKNKLGVTESKEYWMKYLTVLNYIIGAYKQKISKTMWVEMLVICIQER